MTSQPRPVWADENDRDALQWAANQAAAQGFLGWANDLQRLCDQYRDAPADAAEAVTKALTPWTWATYRTQITESALGALGYPHTEQA